MKIKRRCIIRVISYTLAFTAAFIGFAAVKQREINDYKTQMGYNYSMHLDELDGSLNNISLALQKTLYASSASQLSTLAVELCTESTVAKNSLSQLPISTEMTGLNKFLSQVGDYTLFLSKKVIEGREIETSDFENIHALSMAAKSISQAVSIVRSEYDKEGVWNEELASQIEINANTGFSENLNKLEELLADYPSLVYDGPFSDHMLTGEMKMLAGEDHLTSREALQRGSEILGIDVSGFKEESETAGRVPCYNFTDGSMTFSVTKQGGYVIFMRKYREIGEHKVSYDDAIEIAKEYLNSVNGINFQSTYYFADEGVCTINFAHKEGVTICYPDLIKVGVALDTGEVVFIEAAGYIANHYSRSIATPKYSVAEASASLSKALHRCEKRSAGRR